MSLLDSPAARRIVTPLKTTSLPSEAYVLSIVSLPSVYALSASSPDNAIHIFDKSRLDRVRTIAGHEDSVTGLRSASNFAGAMSPVLLSCGKDGVVKAWDGRAPGNGPIMIALTGIRPRALLSCDISIDGTVIVAGTELHGDDASLLYWDPRSPAAPLRIHSSTHSDDITAVRFSKINQRHLLSVSSDGLLCTSNADEADEDEAGLHVGNWGCSIAQAGWVHTRASPPRIWASSDMETFSIWSGELDLVQDVDIRRPSIHRGDDFTWITDYFIGAHNYHTVPHGLDNDLNVFVGSNEGDVALLTRSTFKDPSAPWLLSHTWQQGHVGVVRSMLWDEENNILLTGGEDSKLNAWSGPSASLFSLGDELSSPSSVEHDDFMDVDDSADAPTRKRRRSG
ncbi:WD40 repeat-like protein [Daedalea quercina L-15889]|uniref:WD40 repeat-like protein n=1 Tax=Daedalea quercina L-15889 TaxID=1314783 RepID=A0A165SYX1_9APHY|nr:WD40 repeat-like protein [Daedalea quercina L-15889]